MRTDIAEVIISARKKLGLQHTTMHEADLRDLANEGANQLQLLDNTVVSCEIIDIECGRGKLPEFCDHVIAISPMPNSDGSCCLCSGEEILHDNTGFSTRACACLPYYVSDSSILLEMTNCGAQCAPAANIYYTQAGYLILRASTNGRMKILYSGKNVDSNGLMIIDEDYIRAISCYVAYNFASSGANFNKYNFRQIQMWESIWTAQKANLKALNQKKYLRANKARFTAIAKAIVTNPLFALAPHA